QTPPLFSAVKYMGRPLYEYARKGRQDAVPMMELKRRVKIYTARLKRFANPVATFEVRCAKGTYIRSLARDIAALFDTCATVTRIVRTESAGVHIDKAVSIDKLEETGVNLQDHVLGLHEVCATMVSWRALEP